MVSANVFADYLRSSSVTDDVSFIYNPTLIPDIYSLKTNLREAQINNDTTAIFHNSVLISYSFIFENKIDSTRKYFEESGKFKGHSKHNHLILQILEFDFLVAEGKFQKAETNLISQIFSGMQGRPDILYRKGLLEDNKKNYSKAYHYYQDALKANTDKNLASIIMYRISKINYLTGNFTKGLRPANENRFEDLDRISAKLDFKAIMDSNKVRSDKLLLALNYANKSLLIAEKNSNLILKRDLYELLAMIYNRIGESEIALKYHKLFEGLKDLLVGASNSRNLAELQDKYNTEKRKKEIESRQKELVMKDLEEAQLKTLVYILSAVSIIVLLLAMFFFVSNHLKKKTNVLLEENNAILTATNNQLIISENKFREANNAKLKLFSIIAQDLRYPINDLLGITQFLNTRYDHLEPELIQETLKDLNNSTRKIHNLMENLLFWSESQLGIMKFYKEELSPAELVEHNAFIFRTLLERKGLSLLNNVNTDLRIYADMESLLTIMKNIISNAIKYSNDGGQIIVDAKTVGKKVHIIFKDFGRGIPQEEIDHIFRIDLHKGGIGNNNLEGSGLGLVLCRELIEKNNGTISVESTVGIGTTVVLELPLLEIQKEPTPKMAIEH